MSEQREQSAERDRSGGYEDDSISSRLFCSDSTQVTNLKIVFTEDDLKPRRSQRSFHPEMVHQIFDNDGIIYGYRDLTIDIYFLANSVQCFVDLRYIEKANEKISSNSQPEDIMAKLIPWLPEGYTTDKRTFLNSLKNENHLKMFGKPIDTFQLYNAKEDTTYKYTITACSVEEPGFIEFHYRYQCMIVWFIDAASQIDCDDPNWMFLYVYESRNEDSSSTTGIYPVGFATVYKFFHFPDKVRARISQFFIIPSCQGIGLGTHLLTNTYKVINELPNVVDITVEDPCPAFTRIRDFLDCQLLMKFESFQEHNVKKGFSNAMYLEGNKHHKINKKQCQRIYEILRLSYIKCNKYSPEYSRLYKEINRRFKKPYHREQRCLKKMKMSDSSSLFSPRYPYESAERNVSCHMSDILSAAQNFNVKMEKLK